MPVDVAQGFIHYGALGLVAFLMVIIWFKKDKKVDQLQERLVDQSERYRKEMVEAERERSREVLEVAKRYDESLMQVEKTLDRFLQSN
jgi:hypothetical protein